MGRRRAILVIFLFMFQVLAWMPLLASSGPARDPAFTVIGVLPKTEEYDDHSGLYSGVFPFLINNSGLTSGSGVLSVTGLPPGWTWDLVEGQSILEDVPSGTVIRVTVHVRATGPLPGTHPFQVVVEPGPAILPFESKVPFLGEFDLSTTPTVQGGATSPVTVQATITNLANGPDQFELTVYLPSVDWWSKLEGTSISPVLSVSESYTWNVTVHIPYSAESTVQGGPGYRVWSKAVSQSDPTVNHMNQTQILVDAHRSIHQDIREPLYTPEGPGDIITVEVVLENDGNTLETVRMSVDAPAGWVVQVPSSVRELDPFERITTVVYIAPSANATTGRYGITVHTRTSDGLFEVSSSTIIAVPFYSAISIIDIVQDGPDPAPGQEVSYRLWVRNSGNHVELVEIIPTVVPEGWAATISPSVLSLEEGGHSEVLVRVRASSDPMKSLTGPHSFGIFARSIYSSATASAPVTVSVRGVASFVLFPEGPVKAVNPVLDPDPVYIFRLRNTGNIQFVASLKFASIEGHASWLQPSRQTITVAPGDVATFHTGVSAPDEAVPGDYRYMVTASTNDGGGAFMRADFLFTVLETDIRATGLQGRPSGSPKWSSDPTMNTEQELEAIVWLKEEGTDSGTSVELSFYIDGNYISSSRTVGPPAAGAPWGVIFRSRLAQGWHNITIRASTFGERDTWDNEASMAVYVTAAPVPVRETAAAAGFAVTTSSLILAAILLNEGWKFKALLLFIVPLYTRLRPEATLDNFTRGRIYGYIEANPGEHYNAIKKALELPNGSLAHHLDMLIREGFVRPETDGNYKRFYPSKMRLRPDGRSFDEPGRMTRIQQIILEAVRDEPGISQREISRELNLSPSTINYHIRLMATSGLLRLERSFGRTRCHVGDKAPPVGEDSEVTVGEDPEM